MNRPQLTELYCRLFGILKETEIKRGKTQIEAAEEIISNPLLRSEDEALSFQAKVSYYQIFNSYNNLIQDYDALYEKGRQRLELWENHPDMQKIYPQAYLVSLSNFLVSSLKKESEEEYMDKLERIKRLAKTSPAMEIQAWQNYYYNYVNYLFSGLEFDKTIEQSGELSLIHI